MIQNLSDYFEKKQEFYLENISYNRIDKIDPSVKEYKLNCIDTVHCELLENGIKVTLKRELKFDPNQLFNTSISFCALLKFNAEKREEVDWNSLNLEDELQNNGQFVLQNLMSRISLLIAQITSSYGQTPVILPPIVVPKNSQ
ncbi:MAG: hypothetical protein KH282_07970 [Clostridiales bacterium]|nr:hypothetical protein [Clostridiales bacterium]